MSVANHRCPYCGTIQTDLWDYDWGTREVMITECSSCNEPIDIVKIVTVTYRVEKGEFDVAAAAKETSAENAALDAADAAETGGTPP